MTISSETTTAGPFEGDGATVRFDFTYKVDAEADLTVYSISSASVATVLTLNSGYTVTLNADQNASPGGYITATVAPASGVRILIDRTPEVTQETDLENQGAYYANTVESIADRLTMQLQMLNARVTRSVRFPDWTAADGADAEMPSPVGKAGKFLVVDSGETGIEYADSVSTTALSSIMARVGVTDDPPSDLNPLWFGAEGDGNGGAPTDDSAAFTLLESLYPGAYVNGGGRTFYLGAAGTIPTGARYYNMTWRVGSVFYPLNPRRRAHPLDGGATVIREGDDAHCWPGPGGQVVSTDNVVGCYVDGYRHAVSVGAPMLGTVSADGGRSLKVAQTIYSHASYEPRGLVGGMLTATRFGVFFALVDSSENVISNGCRFIYTDDAWGTFAEVSITGGEFYPHGELVVAPNGDLIVYGYGGGNIYKAVSTAASNGAAWTISVAKAGSGSIAQPAEPIVVKIATSKYLLIVRDGDGTPGDAWAATSTDGKTWSGSWVPSGFSLGSNPPSAIVWGGRLFFYMFGRAGTVIDNWSDKLLFVDLNANDYYAGVLSGTSQTARPIQVAYAFDTVLIGYLNVLPLRQDYWAGYVIDRETPSGSSLPSAARLIMVGGYDGPPAASASTGAQVSLLDNPSFERWSGATSGISITSTRTRTADRWLFSAAAGTHTAARVENSVAYRRLLATNGRYALNITAASGSGRILGQRFYGRDIMTRMSDRPVALQMTLDGTLPGDYRFYIDYYYGSGGSPTATASNVVVCAQDAMAGGLTYLEENMLTPTVSGVTWGSDNNPYMDVYFYANGSGACDVNFREFGMHYGERSPLIAPFDLLRDGPVLDQYTAVTPYTSSDLIEIGRATANNAFEVFLRAPMKMIAAPTVTMLSPTVFGDFQGSGTALTSFSFGTPSTSGVKATGGVGSTPYTAGNAVSLTTTEDDCAILWTVE